MIRPALNRPGVFIVDISTELMDELSEDWSEPMQVRIEEDVLVFRLVDPLRLLPDPSEVR